ncbi:MAG: hypothetical protein AAGA53_12330 [Pseudomonadota bacterium]
MSTALFLGLWASLKFIRPEWTENIFEGSYRLSQLGLELLPPQITYLLGAIQFAVVFAFATGFKRFWTNSVMVIMSAVGVLGSLGSYFRFDEAGTLIPAYTIYPNNLMSTALPALGALIALFLLRDLDNFLSVSAKAYPEAAA